MVSMCRLELSLYRLQQVSYKHLRGKEEIRQGEGRKRGRELQAQGKHFVWECYLTPQASKASSLARSAGLVCIRGACRGKRACRSHLIDRSLDAFGLLAELRRLLL